MKISEFSVKHSLFANLLSVFIVVVGVVSIFTLRREAFPPVSFDVVLVYTTFRGGSAEKVEQLVTAPLEREIKDVDELDEIVSSSIDGLSAITIRIDPDAKDKAKVVADIQKAIDRVTDLPDEVDERPDVIEVNSAQIAVIKVSVSGIKDEFALQAETEKIKDLLEQIEGVASVEYTGKRDECYSVEPDIKKMLDYHVSFREIFNSLAVQNVDVAAGKMISPVSEAMVKVNNEFKNAGDIENTVIRANDFGHRLKIKDVARVNHGFDDEDILNRAYDTRAITLTIRKRKSGDIIKIVDTIHKTLDKFKENAPPELKIATFYDISYYVRRRLGVLCSNGAIGFLLVIAVLFLFLPPVCAFMTALGIPIAMFISLWAMNYFDFTVNLMTMFGLITVLGMVVDDGIIISENIYRYIEKGYAPPEAAIIGADEVTRPVLATVATTIVAFSPLMMTSGLLGKFLRYIPFMVILALLASLIEAFVILPSHLADFARPVKSGFNRKKNPWFDGWIKFYKAILERAIAHRRVVVGGVCLAFLVSLVVMKAFMPFTAFSDKGVEQFSVLLEASDDSSLAKTTELIRPVEELIESISSKYVDTYQALVGLHQSDRGYDPNARKGSKFGQINVYLTASSKRDKTAREVAKSIEPRLAAILNEYKDKGMKRLYLELLKSGPPSGKDIDVRIRGDNHDTIMVIVDEIKSFLAGIKGVSGISDNYDLGINEINVTIDEERARHAYLSNTDISFAIRSAFSGVVATTIKRKEAEKEINVMVRLNEADRKDRGVFDKIVVANSFGDLVPLKKVIKLSASRSLRSITHLDGKRYVAVTAEVDNSNITSFKANDMLMRKFRDVSSRYPGYSLAFRGENKEVRESLQSFMQAFLIACLLIYLILAIQFNSLTQPFVVMITIPFGLIGFVIAFLIHGENMSILGYMGFIGLTGVVVNDSIVLLDFINKRRSELTLHEAVVEAGLLRLRPVLLTTITTVAGLFTVVYGIGGFDPFLKPMALAISWGLLFATGLTLIVIPCVYLVGEDIKKIFIR